MIYILNYKGFSAVSRAIKLATWSPYSHTAIADHQGRVIEAWHQGGVVRSPSPWSRHEEKTPVTVYRLPGLDEVGAGRIWRLTASQVGKKYDFRALCGFVPGLRWLWKDDPNKWFCSHLTAHACKLGRRPLFSWTTPLYKISPGLIHYSPALSPLGEVLDFAEFKKLITLAATNQ